MTDIAARREARRRRILENPEKRIKLITGINSDDDQENKEEITSKITVTEVKDCEENQIVSDLNTFGLHARNISKLNEHTNKKRESSSFNIYTPPTIHTDVITHQRNQVDAYVDNSELSNFQGRGRLFSKYTLIACLAILVNISFLLNASYIFAQNILFPYMIIILINITENDSDGTRDGNIIVAALILCNINPTFIYKFKYVQAKLSKTLKDFSLYLFSFVLMRAFLQCIYGFRQ